MLAGLARAGGVWGGKSTPLEIKFCGTKESEKRIKKIENSESRSMEGKIALMGGSDASGLSNSQGMGGTGVSSDGGKLSGGGSEGDASARSASSRLRRIEVEKERADSRGGRALREAQG